MTDDENFNLNTNIVEKFNSNLSIQHFKGEKKYKKRHKNISNTFQLLKNMILLIIVQLLMMTLFIHQI